MKTSNKKITKKAVVLSLTAALGLSMSPIVKADAGTTAPKIVKDGKAIKTLVIVKGKTAALKIKKGTYEIKSVKWSSTKTKYATVNKKGVVSAVDYGNGKIKAVVTTDSKKYILKCKFEVIEDEDSEPIGMGGRDGWSAPDSPLVDESMKAIVEKAAAKEDGIAIEPMALLATRDNDGMMSYRFFCKNTPVRPGAKTVYALVEINVNLLGEAVISEMIDTGIEAYGTGNPSGWNEAESPVISKGEGEIFNKATSGLTGVEYRAVALLATQKVRGTEYCFIAVNTIVIPNAVPEPCLVYISVDESGAVTMGDVVSLLDTGKK